LLNCRDTGIVIVTKGGDTIDLDSTGTQLWHMNMEGPDIRNTSSFMNIEFVNSSFFQHTRSAIIGTDNFFYFIWYGRIPKKEGIFLGQKLSFASPNSDSSLNIIQTNKQLNLLTSRSIYSEVSPNFSEDLIPNGKDGFIIQWQNRTATRDLKIDQLIIKGTDSSNFAYNLLEIDSNLSVLRNEIYDTAAERPFYHGFGRRSWFTGVSHFDAELHLYNPESDIQGDFHNDYLLRRVKSGTNTQTLSAHQTNLKVVNSANYQGKLFFLAHNLYLDSVLFFDDTKVSISERARNGNSLYLCSLDSMGNFTLLDTIISAVAVDNVLLSEYDDKLWCKVQTQASTLIPSWTSFTADTLAQTVYLCYDKTGQFLLGAKGAKGYSDTWRLGQFVVQGDFVYDVDHYNGWFAIEDTVTSTRQGDILVYTKTQIGWPPKAKPGAYLDSVNCSSYSLHYSSADAEHYTIFVTPDSLPKLNINYKNFNYSPDYLKTPRYKDDIRVLYQGPDTSILVRNLISGRDYYFSIIPGKGASGNSVYNIDSARVLYLSMSRHSKADSVYLSPGIDTSICEHDTLYFKGNSRWNYWWTDGKQEANRLLVRSGSYAIVSADSAHCIIGSDTLNYSLVPNPEAPVLEIASSPPYCKGDTIQIAAKDTLGLEWGNGETSSRIYVSNDGWYKATLTSNIGCHASDSLWVGFGKYPDFRFSQDSVIGFDGDFNLDYTTNAHSLNWYYLNDTLESIQDLLPIGRNQLRVRAFSEDLCWIVDSILINNFKTAGSIFPNAFSPNGDGINDVWYFIHPDTMGTLVIFDRRGAVVHQGVNYWDGKKNGDTLPVATYQYIYLHQDGKADSGKIHLIR